MAPGLVEPVAPRERTATLSALTESYDDCLRFYLNGTKVVLDEIDPEVTLLEYLRGVGLTGTKLGCAEGGCGACTVVVSSVNPTTNKIYYASVNACLAPLVSVDGKHVITIEHIGSSKNPHPAQQRIAQGSGSQCGFCTPGIVMSLYALLRNQSERTELDIEEAFDGNLCRCTGYRPILDAAQTFANKPMCGKASTNGGSGCCMETAANGEANGNGGGCCKSKQDFSNGPDKKFLPPNFIAYDPDTELIFPPSLRKHEFRPLAFGNKKKRWYRPVTVDQLLEIKSAFPSAKLIGGSSETQIEIKFKAMQYTASVYLGDIPELKQFKFHDNFLEIGGNISLTDLEHVCEQAVEHYGPARGQPFAAIKKQLKFFAGRQIRNVGTPAGNLATASPISDLNPVFVATNTTLVARSLDETTEIPMTQFFKGYRQTALTPDAIISSLRIPAAAANGEFFRAYKQAKRKDDDIAIVNAALRVQLSESHEVEDVSLVYGGMAPTTVAAKHAQAYLLGKKLFEPATLEGTMNALEKDFDLQFGVPGGMATYRKTLALSFFFRFWHDVVSQLEIHRSQADANVVEEIEREISTGYKDHDTAVAYEKKILGKEHPHVAALKQCTGEALYTDDIPVQKNELYGCLVLSAKPHAKILDVDIDAALDIPGVVDYVCYKDLPNLEANMWGAPVPEPYFAIDEVFTAGQPIGMILGTSARIAEAGSRAVKVKYEDLPHILTIEEAIEQGSYFDHYRVIKKGDAEGTFKDCEHVFEGIARMGGQEHFYLETNACVVWPKEKGELEVFSSTQNPTEIQAFIAKVCDMQANKIVSRVKRLGGGFGGKETRSIQLAGICALAARKTNRPVRCQLNRDEDIITSGQRHPFLGRWKVGVDKNHKIQALHVDVFGNGGWSQDLSGAVVERCMTHSDGVYSIPNVLITGRACKTNTVSNTAFRGFGGPQGLFIAETYIEEVADHLGISAHEFRQINMYKQGDITHFNQELKDYYVPLMYDQVMQESDYASRREAITEYNKTHKWTKKGLALIPTKFGISFTALFLNQAGALVHVYHDGSILVAHGGCEMGQGLHTKMSMIAAEALGVPLDDVFISETATNTVANTSATAASASSDLNGYAIFNACEQINARLAPYREKLGPNASMKELAHAAYFDRVNLSANGFYKTPDIGYVWGENKGQMYFYFTQGVTCAEVEIDTLTGDWTCTHANIKMDVGRSINPAIDYGQIEGAFVQGMGLFTMEESLWHRGSGQIFTRGPGAYKIPGFRDIPQDFRVTLLKDVQWENLRTIQRSRGVGEPPLFMGSAVFFAIRDALKAARAEWGELDVLKLISPATPERIRISCADPIVKRAYVAPKEGEKSFFVAI